MSIFGTIMSKIFGSDHPAATAAPAPSGGAAAPSGGASGGGASAEAAPPTAPAAPAPPPGQTGGGQSVDVAAVLDGMEGHAEQKLDWRHSIVDLMKLLGMDSSLSARKELAHELSYTGDTNDSASMNIWLHKQVMTKFAENGGKLPPDLKH